MTVIRNNRKMSLATETVQMVQLHVQFHSISFRVSIDSRSGICLFYSILCFVCGRDFAKGCALLVGMFISATDVFEPGDDWTTVSYARLKAIAVGHNRCRSLEKSQGTDGGAAGWLLLSSPLRRALDTAAGRATGKTDQPSGKSKILWPVFFLVIFFDFVLSHRDSHRWGRPTLFPGLWPKAFFGTEARLEIWPELREVAAWSRWLGGGGGVKTNLGICWVCLRLMFFFFVKDPYFGIICFLRSSHRQIQDNLGVQSSQVDVEWLVCLHCGAPFFSTAELSVLRVLLTDWYVNKTLVDPWLRRKARISHGYHLSLKRERHHLLTKYTNKETKMLSNSPQSET